MDNWITIAPIHSYYNDKNKLFDKKIFISDKTQIIKTPQWFYEDKELQKLLSYYQKQLIENSEYCFVVEYKAASLDEPDPSWNSEPRSKQSIALENIMLLNMALWLSKPTCIGFELFMHIQDKTKYKLDRECGSQSRLVPHERDKQNFLAQNDLDNAIFIHKTILKLNRKGNVWMSLHTLWISLTQHHVYGETRYMLLWIVLEALFGTDIEIAHRISERISFFISGSKSDVEKNYSLVKKCYGWRSKVVHGMKLHKLKQDEAEKILYDTETFVRLSLNKILHDKTIIELFDSKGREKYLDSLIFQ